MTSAPILAVSKTDSPDPVAAGGNLTYTLSYSNTGNANATGVVLTDTVPANTTFVSATAGGTLASGVVTWSVGNLAAGATGSVQMVVRIKSPLPNKTTITNSAYSIDSNETSAVGGAAVTTTVTSAPGLLIHKKHSPDPVPMGSDLTYTIDYSNTGSADATGVVATDSVPTNTTFVSATSGGSLSGGVVTWNLGTVPAGASASVQVVVRVASPLPSGTQITSNAYQIGCAEMPPVAGPADVVSVVTAVAPTVTSAVETATTSIYIVQAGVHTIRVTGTNFQQGAVLNLSADISIGPTTLIDSTRLEAVVRVDAAAGLGPRTLTLTNPDLGSGSRPGALTVVRTPDINGDCFIDGIDLNAIARAWNTRIGEVGFSAAADLDGDDYVGPDDLTIFTEYFGTQLSACP
ncbi:MAG: hypothetical protein DMF52_11600 [Acidobacteria bacterium]|nr:MAG: hypothetical protein DMF52_11600 [Acidobacteriota bacterium]